MEIIEKIRKEIERKIGILRRTIQSQGDCWQSTSIAAYEDILALLDSLQEETPTTYYGTVDEDSFLQLGNGEFIDLCPGLDKVALGLKPGDKVKLIVLKAEEDEK